MNPPIFNQRLFNSLVAFGITAATVVFAQPAFRSGVQTVVIHATVQDADGRLVPDLTRETFSVFDNGTPVEISTFSNDIQPITVALMLDMSGSMYPRVVTVRDSTFKFIDALRPEDRVRIGTFGAEIALSPILTGDKTILKRIAGEELWPGGGTPLWNAMYAGMESLANEPGRRILLVLTDGINQGSVPGRTRHVDDVRDRAMRGGFMIYAIGMEGLNQLDVAARRRFEVMIAETGGGHFQLRRDADLDATFTRIADELRHQYLLGFIPAVVDGRQHTLDVRVQGSGLRVRARTSYVAGQKAR
jgi:Ca-activated chloride channel homolog